MVYMKKGIEKGCTTKGVTVKMIPQFADMPATIEDNLFYSSIKLMPSTFLKKQKGLTAKYTATINDKLIPQFKKMTAFLKNEYPHHENKRNRKFTFGKELYATYAKQWTTTEMSPDEIHALGLKEV
jgi:uncharacterized protein (DUF885 family)